MKTGRASVAVTAEQLSAFVESLGDFLKELPPAEQLRIVIETPSEQNCDQALYLIYPGGDEPEGSWVSGAPVEIQVDG
jgi:hypothetical protein